jgi:predicted AlkP superfamily pyrophosphatase or phosphodiesterase
MTLKLLATLLALSAAPAMAQDRRPAPETRPRLVIAISVDQFSADLFAEYRPLFSGGLRRLSQGMAFPAGYQSHASTETCPGHSTILTGARPGRTGIIANNWFDQRAARADKNVYCSEDERVPGATSDNYTVSAWHLRVPTLGDLMRRADPRSRVVAVAGKDRAAVMMGGHNPTQRWFRRGRGFVTSGGHWWPLRSLPALRRASGACARSWLALAPLPRPARRSGAAWP